MTRFEAAGARLCGMMLLGVALAAPGEAQQAERRGGPERGRGAAVEREAERPRLVRQAPARAAGRVPPGWCIGEGNPHGTRANCGYSGWQRDRDGWRVGDRRYRSFEQAHDTFHRQHDLECRARLAERPLDPAWQIRTRAECRAEHERWHQRNDPAWPRTRH